MTFKKSVVNEYVSVSGEVRDALDRNCPIVALESSPISHSFGYEVALSCEEAVRSGGAVPATVAVIDGRVRVGLETSQMDRLASDRSARKLGTRDLASCLSDPTALGGTTIGSTIRLAHLSGIHFTSASGLGGVHRGFSERPDISADLLEIARSPVVVVSTGFKSILDVDATAEILETFAVPVIGWRTSTVPRYYVSHGGPATSARAENARDIAVTASHHWNTLSLNGGILVCRPPREDLEDLEDLIVEGVKLAAENSVTGPDVTLFIMSKLREASNGRTAKSAMNMMIDNAHLAGEIAREYTMLGKEPSSQ